MIALDLSRLLSRAGFTTPTGIDRVELAYARRLIGHCEKAEFAAINAIGEIAVLPRDQAIRFVTQTEALWHDGDIERVQDITNLARQLRWTSLFGQPLRRLARRDANCVYLLVSHSHLHRAGGIAQLKRATVRFVCLIHDLIPLDHSRHASAAQTRRHRRRIETVAALADAVVVNSAATKAALVRRIGEKIPITVAPLGLDRRQDSAQPANPPYFVCLGTIEPRKNHALLLDVWQRLIQQYGGRTPRLVLVGRRGWNSASLTARLAQFRPFVEERAGLADAAVTELLRGARALLLPSLAEGFGLPVIEALALGVPVLCSDLPALRESGAGVPDYLDPGDSSRWEAAISEYLTETPRREAQLQRLAQWQPPRWDEHFAALDQVLGQLNEPYGSLR